MLRQLRIEHFAMLMLFIACQQRSGSKDQRSENPHGQGKPKVEEPELEDKGESEITTKKPGEKIPTTRTVTLSPPSEASPSWIAKASRALRYGKRLSETELKDLTGKHPDEVIDYFIKDKDFSLSLLDFNLFFLGYKQDSFQDSFGETPTLNDTALSMPQALQAVLEFQKGGDYFKFFDYQQPVYVAKLDKPRFQYNRGVLEFLGIKSEQFEIQQGAKIRELFFDKVVLLLNAAQASLVEDSSAAACDTFAMDKGESLFSTVNSALFTLGLPFQLSNDFISAWDNLEEACDGQTKGGTKNEMSDKLKEAQTALSALVDSLKGISEADAAATAIQNTQELPNWQPKDLFQKNADTSLGLKFFTDYTNSSTNANRRRAAHILRTYFCDNLVPVAVINVSEHREGDKHASDPNCYSCHYKLDPMAGFFRNYGIVGINFEDSEIVAQVAKLLSEEGDNSRPVFVFDDQATLNPQQKMEYYETWKGGTENNGWNIGYIRSSSDLSKNAYGNTLEDLFKIIRSAPEVKQCLVQRMAEYFIGGNLTFDLGWLQAITSEMSAESNGTQGIKKAIKLIVNSHSFREQNPIDGKCYDFVGKTTGDGKGPPCEVNAILQQNCISCHNSTKPTQGLDLSNWAAIGSGRFGFSHSTANGRSYVDPCVSFEKIKQRISSTDLGTVMPPGAGMESSQKEKLFLWLDARLVECQGGGQ